VIVASAAGITARSTQVHTLLYIDQELMEVVSISGTTATVRRGASPTRAATHSSGAVVWLGAPGSFANGDPSGACTAAATGYSPRIVPSTRRFWSCVDSEWVEQSSTAVYTRKNVGAAETGVTAVEYGHGHVHTTKLTFTALAIGSGATADLGFGAKLYTFPAGALLVTGAYMNVALTGSGAGCDADTPDGGLGTVVASGVVKVLGGTATFEDILTGQTFNNLTGTAEVKSAVATLVRESGDAHTVYFNLADDWAGACAVTATGTVALRWELLN
jgi:hypothetical protein